ncbi:MAG TPA: hypothetical protein PKU97_04575, partial [Kofleriaceae bacterium]|nr:hypothetical protein [Kofleriaceae bacterium]
IAREPLRVVQSRVRVDRHEVEVVVVVLGKSADAERSRARMDVEIRQASGVTPRLEILAVPDANAIAGLESTLLKPQHVETPTAAPATTPDEQLDSARARVGATLGELWPASSAGAPIVVDLGTSESGPLVIRVVHLGPKVAVEAQEALQRAASRELGREVAIVDVDVPATALTRDFGDLAFVARVSSAVRATAGIAAMSVCVIRPAEPERGRRLPAAEVDLARTLDEVLSLHPRVTMTRGGPWSVTFSVGPCGAPPAPDAGARGAAPGDR